LRCMRVALEEVAYIYGLTVKKGAYIRMMKEKRSRTVMRKISLCLG
jgi:hypothetical protein